MESIRNFLKSWPGRIFLMFCLSPLVILGLESYFSGSGNTNAVVTVGDKVVSRDMYQNTLTSRRNELIQQGVAPSDINDAVLGEEVLESLISRALLQQQTKKLGMQVSDSTINNLLLQEPQYLDENGNFSNDRFAFALQQQGLTKDALFAQYRQQLNMSQLYASIAENALFSDEDVREFIAQQLESREVWLHRLPWEDFKDQVTVSPSELEAYYNEHQNELNSVAMVDLAYVAIDPEALPVDVPSEEEIEAQYQVFKANYEGDYAQRISQILVTGDNAEQTIQTVVKRLNNGEDFTVVAAEVSEDTESSANGGDIGTFNADAFGADGVKVDEALQGLVAGEVSDPVKTSFGYQVFKVTDISGDPVPSIESMREQLVQQVERQQRSTLVSEKITRINEMAIDGLSINDIAQQEALQPQTIKNYTKVYNRTPLNQPAVIRAAFDDFSIQDEAVSTSITTDNRIIWVQPSNYRPVTPLTFEQASDQIKADIVKQKAVELALVDAKRMAATVNVDGMNEANIDFAYLGTTNRQNPQLTPSEKAVAFSEPVAQNELKAVAQATDMGASVLVIGPLVKVATTEISPEERRQTATVIKQRRGQESFSDYLAYLKTATPIEKNEAILSDLTGVGQ